MLKYLETDTSLDVMLNRVGLLKRILDINVKLLKDTDQDAITKLGVTNGKLKTYI